MLSKSGPLINSLRNINHYQTLGIHQTSTTKEIKSKFRELSKECHPDKFPDNPVKEAKFKRLNDAYQVLSDKSEKEIYDKTMVGSGRGNPGNPIRSAQDYARYKRESDELYNEFSDKNDRGSASGGNKYGFEQETNFGGRKTESGDSGRKWEKSRFGSNYQSNHQSNSSNSKNNPHQHHREDHEPHDPNSTLKKAAGTVLILILLNKIGSNNRKAYEQEQHKITQNLKNSTPTTDQNQQKTQNDPNFNILKRKWEFEYSRTNGFGQNDKAFRSDSAKNTDKQIQKVRRHRQLGTDKINRDPDKIDLVDALKLPRIDYNGQNEMRKMSVYNEKVRMEKMQKEWEAEKRKRAADLKKKSEND